MGCTPQYATKKPDSAPHRAAAATAQSTAAQILKPASLQSTPSMILVRPMMDATWISIPPPIITIVTNSVMMQTLI